MNGKLGDRGPCAKCGLSQEKPDGLVHYPGVDPCLGLLPDVVQACCGHGRGVPYVTIAPGNAPGTMVPDLEPGTLVGALYGSEALDYFAERGVGPTA